MDKISRTIYTWYTTD